MAGEGFRMGDAFVQVGLRPPSPADEERTRRDTETGLGKNPPKIPLTLRDPVDAAFRARLNSELQAAAKSLAALPVDPDTERFRRLAAAQIKEISKNLEAEVPLDVANAAEWRAKVSAEAAAVSRSVQAHIPVEVDVDQKRAALSRRDLIRWAAEVGVVVGPAGVIGGALLGTAGLFGGLGVAAAASTQDVEDSFAGMADEVSGAVKDMAKPFGSVLTGIAQQARVTFREVEGEIGSAMKASAPEVADLADGVIVLSRNALPGLTTALQRSAPVIRELDDDMGELGHTVADFFVGLSGGAGGAALGLHALLSDVDAVLPPIGRFVGALSEVTGEVLTDLVPAFRVAGTVLDGVSFVLNHTSGLLGSLGAGVLAVATAWKAWGGIVKIADSAQTAIVGITESVRGLRAASIVTAEAEAGVTAATSTMSLATGGVIVLLAGLALALTKARREEKSFSDQAKELSSDLLAGGRSAEQAEVKLGHLGDALRLNVKLRAEEAIPPTESLAESLGIAGDQADGTGRKTRTLAEDLGLQSKQAQHTSHQIADLSDSLKINAKSHGSVTKAIRQTKTALDDQLDSMHATPLAMDLVNDAFDTYVQVAQKHGSASDQAKVALDILNGQIQKATQSQTNLDGTLSDPTAFDIASSAADQLDAALQKIITSSEVLTLGLQRQQQVEDAFAADIALRQATLATAQAQQTYADTLKHNRASSAAAQQATNDLLAAMQAQAQAAQQAAEANYTGADSEGKAAAGAKAYRATLVALSQHAGGPLKDALLGTIARLDEAAKPRTTDLYADITQAEAGIAKAEKGYSSLPRQKRTVVDADITALRHKIAVANHDIQSLHSKTVGIDVNIVVHGNEIIVGFLGKGPHAMAAGGVVKPIHGGQVVRVAEAGVPEAVIPLDPRGARFIQRAFAPLVAQRQPAPAAATAALSGVPQIVLHNPVFQVQASQLSDMQSVIEFFRGLPQAARTGGRP